MMSRKVAFGGILTALCVVLVYIAAYLPSGKLGLYALSSFVIATAVVELDIKWGAIVYIASAILIFLLTGNVNTLLLFLLFFGSYPFFKYYIEKQQRAAIEMLLKFIVFNILVILVYLVYKVLLGLVPVSLSFVSWEITAGIVLAAQVAFLVYDYVLSRLIDYYIVKIKPAVRR